MYSACLSLEFVVCVHAILEIQCFQVDPGTFQFSVPSPSPTKLLLYSQVNANTTSFFQDVCGICRYTVLAVTVYIILYIAKLAGLETELYIRL